MGTEMEPVCGSTGMLCKICVVLLMLLRFFLLSMMILFRKNLAREVREQFTGRSFFAFLADNK